MTEAGIYATHRKAMNERGFTLWFTGLPCSGKSTLADAVAQELKARGLKVERLDGDIIRQHLWKELGFSREDRDENIRRVTFLAKLLSQNGVAVLTSFISPCRQARQQAREEIGDFVEVYVKCPVEICIQRDSKGLFRRALAGELQNFTGISDPYEEPLDPEVVVESDREPLPHSAAKVLAKLEELGYLAIPPA